MLNTDRMASRLPLYIQAYRRDSDIRAILNAFGLEMEQVENAMGDLMRSKWFFHADLGDLERMGILFGVPRLPGERKESYRQRFSLTIRELLTGAGTVESIRNIVEATMGSPPEILENPPEIVLGPVRELGVDGTWREFNNSIREDHPLITVHPLSPVRDPAITNITTQETILYRGLLRKGSSLRLMPDGTASLAGIDVSKRIEYYISDELQSEKRTPRIPRSYSDWKYLDASAFFDFAHFAENVFAANEEHRIAIQMKWMRYQPATFDVRIPIRSKLGEAGDLVGYEKRLRQEVRHLVDHVKSAGVMANVNFFDNFVEKNRVRDLGMQPVLTMQCREDSRQKEELKVRAETVYRERQGSKDEMHSCGVFNMTEFDSQNTWA